MTRLKRARDGLQCVVRGCGRMVKGGKAVCRDHLWSAEGRRVREAAAEAPATARAFLEHG